MRTRQPTHEYIAVFSLCVTLLGIGACGANATGREDGIVIVAPKQDARYMPREPVSIVVDLASGSDSSAVTIERVIVSLGDHQEALRGTPPWKTEVTPRAESIGPVTISAVAIVAGDPPRSWFADDVTISIDSATLALRSLGVAPHLMVCSRDTTHVALTVTGVFDDGITRELTTGVGTAYTSSRPDVATVGPDGVVECLAVGQTIIRATFRNLAVTSRIVVEAVP